jgi:DNA-binding NarL/FixJ family response regulator
LVESRTEVSEVFRSALEMHKCFQAKNRADASWMFIENRPDIVLVNKNLRGMTGTGVDAVEDILYLNPSAKVIMYAPKGAITLEDELTGVELFLTDQLTREKIVAAVEAVLSLRHAMLLVPC